MKIKSLFKTDVLWKTLAVAREAKPKSRLLVLACVCTAFASLFQLVGLGLIVPVLNGLVDERHYEALVRTSTLGRVISQLPFETSNQNIFLFIVFLILLSVYLENVLVFLGQFLFSKIVTDINHSLRVRIFERYMGFAKPFYDRQKIGQLNLILTDVVSQVGQHFHVIGTIVIALAFSFAFFAMMLIISWRLTLMALIIVPIINVISRGLIKKIRSSSTKEINHLMSLSNHSLDLISNVQLAQLSGMESKELSRLEALSDRVRHHGFAARARTCIVPRIIDIINSTGIVVLGCAAVFLFISVESSSIGRLSVFFISLRRLASHVEQLTGAWAHVIAGMPALEKVLWVFQNEDKAAIDTGDREFLGVKESIAFNNVRFSYADNEVLKGIDVSIPVNKTLAVVGPTGSGKTTMLSLLARFYECDSGVIKVDETDIREFIPSSYRSKIALVSQSALLVHGTIRRNICYGLDEGSISDELLEQAARNANIHDFIVSLPRGYDTTVGGEGVRLSGGEKQRLSIARAFLRNPQILILDEPTSSLDAATEELIQLAVDNVSKNRTVFVVAHRLSTVKNADYLIVLDNGGISEEGTVQDLLKAKGKFFEYCELQRIFY